MLYGSHLRRFTEKTIAHSAIMMNDMFAVPPAMSFSVIYT